VVLKHVKVMKAKPDQATVTDGRNRETDHGRALCWMLVDLNPGSVGGQEQDRGGHLAICEKDLSITQVIVLVNFLLLITAVWF
jgi:hypothetical protein